MSGLFEAVGKLSSGYGKSAVDEFFARARSAYEGAHPDGVIIDARAVREVTFPIARGGYSMQAVDEALDRLESAFIQRERAEHIARLGRQSWLDSVADRAKTLYPRLLRPMGERFAHPKRGRGYRAAEVDEMCNRLIGYFDEGRPLASADLRYAIFPSARGKSAYAEGPVDAFFARAGEVLLAVE